MTVTASLLFIKQQSFIDGNSDAQIGLAATMLPPPPNNPNDPVEATESAGSLLMHTILEYKSTRKDPYAVWFASVLLSHVLQYNHQCKTLIINRRVDSEAGEEDDELKVSFLHKCIFTVLSAHQQGADVHVILGILCLLAIWLYECPEAVREFLSEGSNIQFVSVFKFHWLKAQRL